MDNVILEVHDNLWVATNQGIVRFRDLARRAVEHSLWGVRWVSQDNQPTGVSFHPTHKAALAFKEAQKLCKPDGPAKLVKVSQWLVNKIEHKDSYWTDLTSFDQAETYNGPRYN